MSKSMIACLLATCAVGCSQPSRESTGLSSDPPRPLPYQDRPKLQAAYFDGYWNSIKDAVDHPGGPAPAFADDLDLGFDESTPAEARAFVEGYEDARRDAEDLFRKQEKLIERLNAQPAP
jgi:hypothetical protein